jgi:hypothetical protein
MPAANTYIALASQTLSATAASITFSNISQAYTDLVLVTQCANTTNTSDIAMRFNADSGTNYSQTIMYAASLNAAATRTTNSAAIYLNWYGNMPTTLGTQVITASIQSYANTTTFKPVLSRANNGNNALDFIGAQWRSTAAITSITVFPTANLFSVGSLVSLYGILAA